MLGSVMLETQYCHNTECEEFNQPQEFAYRPTTWESPSEWIEDPECRSCYNWCEPDRVPTQDRVAELLDQIAVMEPIDSFEKSNEIYALVHHFVKEWE